MRKGTRLCTKCKRYRQERFYTSPRGRVCTDCQRKTRRTTSHGARIEVTYGITRAEWLMLFKAQGGVCAICKGRRGYNLDVDHDHALAAKVGIRRSIRGLLCKRCNRQLLPAAWGSSDVLRAAADYLDKPPARGLLQTGRRIIPRR